MYHTVIIHRPMRITSDLYRPNAIICLVIVNIISCVSPETIWII